MPSGKVHDRLTWGTAAVGVPVWCSLPVPHDPIGIAVVTLTYLFSGLWLSDDLDTRSVSYRRWGPLKWIWWPYQKAVRHRSWVSHGIAVGPLIRVAYCVVMAWAITRCVLWVAGTHGLHVQRDVVLGAAANWTLTQALQHPTYTTLAIIGLVLGGVTHSIADTVVSGVKRLW